VALGLGDQELEQRLRPALDAADDLDIVAQCLAAEQVLQLVEARQVDALVLAWTLHRLTDAVLDQLGRAAVPVVLLVADPREERWRSRSGPVLPMTTDASTVRQAVLAGRGGHRTAHPPSPGPMVPDPVVLQPVDRAERAAGSVIAVTGGVGGPGRTTVAISLAAALGAAEPTVLVELDLSAPAIVAHLDADPSRNLCTLAHSVRENPGSWSAALEDELQPLGPHPHSAVVLCGPPKREMRTSIAPALVERLIDELARRHRWVILDVGPDLLGAETPAANHRVALACANTILLVAGCDLVSLWHARTALDHLERLLGVERRALNLVLNKHDLRFHHSRAEVEWHLGAPVVAVIPFDEGGLQRAISEQRPLVLDHASRAARALMQLAEAINERKLRVPSLPPDPGRQNAWWSRLLGARRVPALRRSRLEDARSRRPLVPEPRSGRAW
jgi:MinD-like ATPase involved in chromosome partitioning or flagellar assembly